MFISAKAGGSHFLGATKSENVGTIDTQEKDRGRNKLTGVSTMMVRVIWKGMEF
jgi:hypothetical protein